MGQVRLLTGEKRKKVKVLAVLYDGGKHAEEVRKHPYPLPQFPSKIPIVMVLDLHPRRDDMQTKNVQTFRLGLGMRGRSGADLSAQRCRGRQFLPYI